MRGFLFSAASALLLTAAGAFNSGMSCFAQEVREEKLDSIVVSATRAGKSTPVTYTNVSKDELRSAAPMNSLPMVLSLQPSVITTNEGGTGLGYSSITVRGSQGTQINVTLNGITLNDSESQEVFWVNIPSLTNILSSVQLQRGLGTSANGAGAFGASINMSTASVGPDPFANFEVGLGSWNTFTTAVSAGTGLTDSGLYFNFTYSRNTTDGYLRNAYAEVQSAMAVLGWMGKRNSLKLTWLMGDQRTGITWNGEPWSEYDAGNYKYNDAGSWYDQYGNIHYYDNETDNYSQNHLQLNYTHQFSDRLFWSTTANWTNGYGYYEQYKASAKVSKYGYSSPLTGSDGEEYSKADFLIRKKMNNDYLVATSSLRYTADKLNVTGGFYTSWYNGDHFGNVFWCSVLGDEHSSYGKPWYDNVGKKIEANAFVRAEWTPVKNLTAYVDLQYRWVSLDMSGTDDDQDSMEYETDWNFFNPRAGVTYNLTDNQKVYASVALGHREPGRSDLRENIKSVIDLREAGDESAEVSLRPERMIDIEAGYSFEGKHFSANANIYLMEYRNMLLETGKLSSTGRSIKENVPKSYRRGIELAAAWTPSAVLRLDGNATFSVNRLKDYTAYWEEYDNSDDWNYIGQYSEYYDKVDMLMSPSVIAMGRVSVTPFALNMSNSLKTTTLSLSAKHVGKQYWDNTGSSDRRIPAYTVLDLGLSHEFNLRGGKLGLAGYVQNLLNNRYYADAWVYRAHFTADDSWYQEEGVFPQAPTNFMVKLTYSF